ncbi:MAG: AAA family ATPase [Magnetococcales bacterium]|nr:AAA family ATPase [Magnetococcales bacterium]
MLAAITLKNFRSYRQQARLPLSSLTVLIGANASGKSNAIEGVRLLGWLAQKQNLSAIQYAVQNGDRVVRGTIGDLVFDRKESRNQSFGLGVETNEPEWNRLTMTLSHRGNGLHIIAETLTHPHASVPLYVLDQPSVSPGTDVSVAYNNFVRGRNKPRVTCTDQMAIFTQLTTPAIFANHRESKKLIPPVTKQIGVQLSAILFLDPAPNRMRDYTFPSETSLQSDGRNLSAVLYNLWGKDKTNKNNDQNRKDILAFIQNLPEQKITNLSFIEEPRGGVMVQLTETFGDKKHNYDASLLSDGTLRVLSIAAALLSAPAGSLVVIEEIDNGVHPSRANRLIDKIQSIAKRRGLQVLLSTHNPALLDALPDSALPDVVFCYRDPKEGSSRLVRLQDVPDYPGLVAQGSLGELVSHVVLERFVKQPCVDTDRKTKALAWLESLRQGCEP